jgi:hypothetical protein
MNVSNMNTLQYNYFDGSANEYEITESAVRYIPIETKHSSTGFYSGGKPAHVGISKEEFRKISDLLEAAVASKDLHLHDRMKTTGMIVRIEQGRQSRFVLPGKSEPVQNIETFLRSIISRTR